METAETILKVWLWTFSFFFPVDYTIIEILNFKKICCHENVSLPLFLWQTRSGRKKIARWQCKCSLHLWKNNSEHLSHAKICKRQHLKATWWWAELCSQLHWCKSGEFLFAAMKLFPLYTSTLDCWSGYLGCKVSAERHPAVSASACLFCLGYGTCKAGQFWL